MPHSVNAALKAERVGRDLLSKKYRQARIRTQVLKTKSDVDFYDSSAIAIRDLEVKLFSQISIME